MRIRHKWSALIGIPGAQFARCKLKGALLPCTNIEKFFSLGEDAKNTPPLPTVRVHRASNDVVHTLMYVSPKRNKTENESEQKRFGFRFPRCVRRAAAKSVVSKKLTTPAQEDTGPNTTVSNIGVKVPVPPKPLFLIAQNVTLGQPCRVLRFDFECVKN